MQCAPFVNICVNCSLRRGLGQCRCVLYYDGIVLHFIDKDINITRSLVRRMLDDASKVCMTASQRIFMARDCREWL